MTSCIALIPARAGSQRIRDKNIRYLGKHPLIAYAITGAIDAGIFARVIVSTDSEKIAKIAKYYGAEVPSLRPKDLASSVSPDIDWVRHELLMLQGKGIAVDCFSLLRPTSPFRTAHTIQRAWNAFLADGKADSLRAVEKCRQHPAKMWIIDGSRMHPVMENPDKAKTPWHSMQYQALPDIYVQNASLEIAWTRLPLQKNTISGDVIMPFLTEGFEGYDINDEKDFVYANYLVKTEKMTLPSVAKKPYAAA